MFSTISALEFARQHIKVSHDSNNSKSPDITKFGHFGVPKTTLTLVNFSNLNLQENASVWKENKTERQTQEIDLNWID
jgi:hypothetical protein